jgi:hypothetical protein
MAIQAFLRGPRVVRAGDEIAVDRPRGGLRQRLATLRVQLPDTPEIDGYSPPHLGRHDLDEPRGLVVIERQPLAGRGGEDQPVDRLLEIVVGEPPQ